MSVAFQSTGEFDAFFDKSTITHIDYHDLSELDLHKPLCTLPQSPYSQFPFKTQIDFLQSLEIRHTFRIAKQVDYLARTIRFGSGDSKTIVCNDNGILYDIVPHWLPYLPQGFTDTSCKWSLDQEFSDCYFSRANLSFSHFAATDLAQIIIADRSIPQEIPIIMPWLTSWQNSLLSFFGITRRIIPLCENNGTQSVSTVKLTDSFAIEDLFEYEGLHFCRVAAQTLLQSKSKIVADSYKPIVWLGRNVYERSRGLRPRVLNLDDLVNIMKEYSIVYVDPSSHSLELIAKLVYSASLIVSESGSQFINYLLFSSPNTPIIQLSPNGTLGPTWSYYNVNNMQWYHPVMSHLYFYGGNNPPQAQRCYGSPWNTPSTYDPLGLSQLISNLLYN